MGKPILPSAISTDIPGLLQLVFWPGKTLVGGRYLEAPCISASYVFACWQQVAANCTAEIASHQAWAGRFELLYELEQRV